MEIVGQAPALFLLKAPFSLLASRMVRPDFCLLLLLGISLGEKDNFHILAGRPLSASHSPMPHLCPPVTD